MPLLKKLKTSTKIPNLKEEKKNHAADFSKILDVMSLNFLSIMFKCFFFGLFLNEGKPNLRLLQTKDFRWNLAVKCCKTPKIQKKSRQLVNKMHLL